MSNKNNKKKIGRGGLVILIILIAAVIAAVMLWSFLPDQPEQKPRKTTAAAETSAVQTTGETAPGLHEVNLDLGFGLEIIDKGSYTGAYMEDGSNEILSDVMMIIVRNSGDADIQLSDITAVCGGQEYRFRLTNLAVGSQAVLLDLDRRSAVDGELSSVTMDNTAFFSEPMSLREDAICIGGLDGMLNVENVSGNDLSGDIYIYYKYASEDLFYGGITFRVRIEGGLKAGELRQIPAGHYEPAGCTIVQVTIYE